MKTKNQLKLIFSVLVLFLLISPIHAKMQTKKENIGSLTIHRTAPETAVIGQKIWVSIKIENKDNEEKDIIFIERLGNADFDDSQAKYTETDYGEKFWYYRWRINLPAKKNFTLLYWIIPESIGNYVISPAKINTERDVSYLKTWTINIKCKADQECNLQEGENYLTCPEDCSTGLADNICDFSKDDKCDPDCEKESDPDCEKELSSEEEKELDVETEIMKEEDNTAISKVLVGIILVISIIISLRFLKKKKKR